jgi:hypothetical protein
MRPGRAVGGILSGTPALVAIRGKGCGAASIIRLANSLRRLDAPWQSDGTRLQSYRRAVRASCFGPRAERTELPGRNEATARYDVSRKRSQSGVRRETKPRQSVTPRETKPRQSVTLRDSLGSTQHRRRNEANPPRSHAPRRPGSETRGRRASGTAFPRRPWERARRASALAMVSFSPRRNEATAICNAARNEATAICNVSAEPTGRRSRSPNEPRRERLAPGRSIPLVHREQPASFAPSVK